MRSNEINNDTKTEHIEGTVEDVLFRNEMNGYIVLELDTGENIITVVGELGNIEDGEQLALDGVYENNSRFGMQFHAIYCERKLPSSLVNITKYLEGGVIKGIGPSLARRIIEVFGTDTLRVLEEEPEKLKIVKGISQNKCEQIAEESKKLFNLRSISAYLSKFDIRNQYSMRAFQEYGVSALDKIRENPYILCDEQIGLDFLKAELIARELEIPLENHNRIKAAIQKILLQNADNGHTCVPLDTVQKICESEFNISENSFYDAYNEALTEKLIYQIVKDNEREFLFLPEYYTAEMFIADRIQMLDDFQNPETLDFSKQIDEEEEQKNIEYDDIQKNAINVALSKYVMILTGGPGTGKTTTLNAIISIYKKMGKRVLLAAPTGRAAKRMTDLTGYESKTIHRLLEVEYDITGKLAFKHDEKTPLPCDVVIIDEMSMVDVLIFEKLLRALRLGCKVIMVGDVHQLPSVGAGNLLSDLILSGKVPVVELKKIFRQAQKSLIVVNSHKILNGEYPELDDKKHDFFYFQRHDPTMATELILDLVNRRLPKAYGYSSIDDIQVITPTRKGPLGVQELNKKLQAVINPYDRSKEEYKTSLYTYRVGDKVMQNKNNYDILWRKEGEAGKGIYNGDIGKIVGIDKRMHTIYIDFDGRVAPYLFQMLSQIELAYAITVHKSQGSEFEAVIIPVLDSYEKLCDRSLLYTAVTRSKKLLILVGSREEIYHMVDNTRKSRRLSMLKYILEKGTNDVQNEIII